MEQVIVSEYNPEWKKQYEDERVKISEALQDILMTIEHIGSTSVPGLGAKPIIDMMVGVMDLDQVGQEQIDRLMKIGYEYVHKPDFPERKFFRKGKWRAGTHHLHIYEMSGAQWRNNMLFRNYLRNHADTLAQYYQLKKELEARHKHDRVQYTAGKETFIQEVINKATEEFGAGR
ncbi:GrpB domain, predicted nucleotidyltransferase, UPF0157 family [Paenibacillus uliginis N3/975]|uniref:GrpB domain, predicted nucleotidyltransferase, UPF0157 family n=1 Tax=Paenibacillus uliginis N3/975 TaxID=1313296 RepID=A0A1X7HI53_9BACL|nr:GrpB family protein [Paenibacillus uliginis]SMF86989.1 GrpB domain, predicted nucleotidyltransferase, UPF0157 family [Paenibacillus uliginis N3/975]